MYLRAIRVAKWAAQEGRLAAWRAGDAVMEDESLGFVDGLKHCFSDLPDPRVVGRCDHLLLDVIGITLLAVMSGAED